MDLDEWELLPDDGFLEIQDDGGKKIFSRKYGGGDPNSNFFNMNYFICPSPNSQKIPSPPEKPRPTNQLVPVPIKLEQFISHKALDHELVKEFTKVEAPNIGGGAVETDDHQKTVSQVFFNKTKENEFVDMKMDSPRSSGRGILAQVFEDRSEAYKGEAMEGKIGSKVKNDQKDSLEKSDSKEEEEEEEKNDGLNIWKWSLNGIGAICSFGVAAATICIVIFGSQHRNKQQNQKPRFQIYTDEKERIKQVVQHATKFNEAISAVRGVPLTRAHFTFGGHYDGL